VLQLDSSIFKNKTKYKQVYGHLEQKSEVYDSKCAAPFPRSYFFPPLLYTPGFPPIPKFLQNFAKLRSKDDW